MVYNRRHPTEQYRISLKLTAGALRTFFLSPGSKNAHAFWTLEEKITAFLKVGRGGVVDHCRTNYRGQVSFWETVIYCTTEPAISRCSAVPYVGVSM